MTLLAEAARGFGLKLNSAKTLESGDVILSSIKTDKLEWMPQSALFKKDRPSKILSVEKQLLLIYRHGLFHPNAGSLLLPLAIVHKQLVAGKAFPFKPEALIAIVAEIALRNPRACKPCIAIIAKLLQEIHGNDREAVCDSLLKKFRGIPNGGYFEIWLQRIYSPLGFSCEYREPLCKLVNGTMQHLPWSTGFLSSESNLKAIMDSASVVDRKVLTSMKAEFPQEEIDLFVQSTNDYA